VSLHPTAEIRHEYADVNGIRMHYAVAGSGPLVVMLHGFPDFWYTWRRQIPALAGRFTVVAPDQRGYNETSKPAWGYEVDVLVADVLGLVRALGHERAFLVGHDWGAAVAWAAAIAHPQRVARLAVLNVPHPAVFTRHLTSNPRQMLRSSYMAFFQLPWLPELALRAGDFATLERVVRADLGDRIGDDELAAWKRALATPGTLTGGLNWYRAAARRGAKAFFPGPEVQCRVPTLLIHGDSDPFLGPELFVGNERYCPDLRVRPVRDAGHWVHQGEPGLVSDELVRFLGA
jgi:pimeloyl-ACP methyl ester carboxylesterase